MITVVIGRVLFNDDQFSPLCRSLKENKGGESYKIYP